MGYDIRDEGGGDVTRVIFRGGGKFFFFFFSQISHESLDFTQA